MGVAIMAKTVEISELDRSFMAEAIRLASESAASGGGPFGAVIVRDGRIVASGSNSVTRDADPTAHAEVSAIRLACRMLGTHDLSGCTLYTSCEPCPMCLGAIYWAHIDRIFYGNTREDAADVGFYDHFIYEELNVPAEERSIPLTPLMRDEALESFHIWSANDDKKEY